MKKILVILLFFIGKICAGQSSITEKLEADSLIHSYFNHYEILSIAALIEIYDVWILSETQEMNIDKAYHAFFERANNCNSAKDFLITFSLPKKQIDSVFSIFDRNHSVRAFWDLTVLRKNYQTNTISIIITNYRPGSYYKYLNFLKELFNDYPIMESYIESIYKSGSIPPTLVAGTAKNHHRFDFNDIRWRMFYAIHHFTITYKTDFVRIN